MTEQTSAVYDPVVKVTEHSVNDAPDAPEYETFRDKLSELFRVWKEDCGTNAEEQTGETEDQIVEKIKQAGSYQIDGFVGCFFMITVVQ